MKSDEQLQHILTMIHINPDFVGAEQDDGIVLKSLPRVPDKCGVFWLGGITKLQNGRELESVFVVDTDSHGSLLASYWLVKEQWFHQNDEAALKALGLRSKDVFPFDWWYHIALEVDLYHD